jgi:hypothetical protein
MRDDSIPRPRGGHALKGEKRAVGVDSAARCRAIAAVLQR